MDVLARMQQSRRGGGHSQILEVRFEDAQTEAVIPVAKVLVDPRSLQPPALASGEMVIVFDPATPVDQVKHAIEAGCRHDINLSWED